MLHQLLYSLIKSQLEPKKRIENINDLNHFFDKASLLLYFLPLHLTSLVIREEI